MDTRAHRAVSNAVNEGKLPHISTRQCNKCGGQAVDYHHHSYEPECWLDVEPLCRSCHLKLRGKRAEPSKHFGFVLPKTSLKQLKEKQSYIPTPDKLRRLIERYVNNEIKLEDD